MNIKNGDPIGNGHDMPHAPGIDAKELPLYKLYWLGRQKLLLFTSQGYQEAMGYFREAVKQDARFVLAWAAMAETYAYWGYYLEFAGHADSARQCYEYAYQSAERALQVSPSLAEPHRAMALALRRGPKADAQRRRQEARFAFEINPDDAENCYEYWRSLGYDPDNPLIYRALAINPCLGGAYNDLGVVLNEKHRWEEAADCLRRAIEINPRHSLAYCNLAWALVGLGHNDQAETACAKALDINPQESRAHVILSLVYAQKKLLDRSVEELNRAKELDPANAAIEEGLAILARQRQRSVPV
ncbi:MAG: tetratricopeptide repeat protein [Elusimicrobia bacterium]|nr:tetratricopeptide repeat protein [Elusimicrobiota bacterium]